MLRLLEFFRATEDTFSLIRHAFKEIGFQCYSKCCDCELLGKLFSGSVVGYLLPTAKYPHSCSLSPSTGLSGMGEENRKIEQENSWTEIKTI